MFENWRAWHRDNPDEQGIWQTHLYDDLWADEPPDPQLAPGEIGSISIDTLTVRALRGFCFQQADFGLAEHGVRVDEQSRVKLAKAIAAAFQRASVVLEREAHRDFCARRGPGTLPTAFSWSGRCAGPRKLDGPAVAMTLPSPGFLKRGGRRLARGPVKASTHESYRHTIESFVEFVRHNDTSLVTAQDVVGFKDHRLSTPSRRTGRVPSPKTVKDSDLSALKSVFGWAVANKKLSSNPAEGVAVSAAPTQGPLQGFLR